MSWELLGALLALLSVSSGIVLWAVKTMNDASQVSMSNALEAQREYFDQKFSQHEEEAARDAKAWRELDRRFMELLAQLPRDYVMREDWIRFSSVIDAKQDRLGDRQDRMLKQLESLSVQLANNTRSPSHV